MSEILTWDQVLAWRMRRQFVDPVGSADALQVVRRLAGVQAQVASSAALAVALRQSAPQPGEVERALAGGRLVKTWAMRGTLHLLAPDDAGAYLSLMAAGRSWERPSWQRAFGVTPTQMAVLAEAVAETLDGKVLTREELAAALATRTKNANLVDQLRSGWGTVLKPLAWQGHLCHGPSRANRVTFTRPDSWIPGWGGVPDPEHAATIVVPAYLRAHGPASMASFDRWLARGVSKKAALRAWFATLGDRLVTVDVEGEQALALADDVEEMAASKPSTTVRLLPAFDPYVLGPGTQDARLIALRRRAQISRTAGWISPVVVARGRVGGVWNLTDGSVGVTLFEEAGKVSRAALTKETKRLAGVLGRGLRLSVAVDA